MLHCMLSIIRKDMIYNIFILFYPNHSKPQCQWCANMVTFFVKIFFPRTSWTFFFFLGTVAIRVTHTMWYGPGHYFLYFNESPYPDCRRKHRGWWLCKRRAWVGNAMMRGRKIERGIGRGGRYLLLSKGREIKKKVWLRTLLLKSLLTPSAISTPLRVQGQ